MANELTVRTSIEVNDGGFKPARSDFVQIDMTTKDTISQKTTVTTSDTALSFTGLTTPKAIHFKNLDATNYIEIGPDSVGTSGSIVPLIRLLAGESCLILVVPAVTIRVQANVASCDLAIFATDT